MNDQNVKKERILQWSGILKYLFDQLTGNFMGFLIGMSASSLVSRFFETRSLRNLWGLKAKKTVVNKATFEWLQWGVSLVIGFVVFEIVTKILRAYFQKHGPALKVKALRYVVQNEWHRKVRR